MTILAPVNGHFCHYLKNGISASQIHSVLGFESFIDLSQASSFKRKLVISSFSHLTTKPILTGFWKGHYMNMGISIESIMSQFGSRTVDSFGNCTLLFKLCDLWLQGLSCNCAHHHRFIAWLPSLPHSWYSLTHICAPKWWVVCAKSPEGFLVGYTIAFVQA